MTSLSIALDEIDDALDVYSRTYLPCKEENCLETCDDCCQEICFFLICKKQKDIQNHSKKDVIPRLFMTNHTNLFRGEFHIPNHKSINYGIIYDFEDFYEKLCNYRDLYTWCELKKKHSS